MDVQAIQTIKGGMPCGKQFSAYEMGVQVPHRIPAEVQCVTMNGAFEGEERRDAI